MLGLIVWLPYIPTIMAYIHVWKMKKNETTVNEMRLKESLWTCLIINAFFIVLALCGVISLR